MRGLSASDMNKKIFYIGSLALAIILLGFTFFVANKAEASTLLFEQLPATATTTQSGTSDFGMRFFGINPPNWIVDRVGIYVQSFGGAGASATWRLRIRNAANTLATTSAAATMTTGWNYFDIDPQTLSTYGNDMRIFVERASGSGTMSSFVTSFPTASPTQNYRVFHTSGSQDAYPVMRIYGLNLDDPSEGGIITRIISQDSPANGDTTSSNIVSFEFDFYNNDTDEQPMAYAGIDVRDMTVAYEYAPVEQDIIISGIGSFSTIMNLEENHLHLWRPYLRNSDSTRIVYGQWYSFDVVGPSAPFESFIDPETGLPINATSTSFWDFLNVPNLLKTKAPTGYIYQIGTMFSEISNIPSTTTPSLTLSFVAATSSMTTFQNVEVFSYDTVTQFIPDPMIVILRTLMVATLYIGLAFGIIHNSHNMFS